MTYTSRCPACRLSFDWRAARFTSPDPACPQCAGVTARQISAPAIIWSKPLNAYADPGKETFKKDQKNGGHWTFEKQSDRALEAGKPLPVLIETPQQQAAYCRREGLVNPRDLPPNLSVSKDGTSYETANLSEV